MAEKPKRMSPKKRSAKRAVAERRAGAQRAAKPAPGPARTAAMREMETAAAADTPKPVTDDNFEALLLESARQALAIARGEQAPGRQYTLDARAVDVTPPPAYSQARVRRIRARLQVSQQVFAELLHVSGSTVRQWEQGTRTPTGPTRRLLEIAEKHPDAVLATARKATRG